MRPKRFSLSPSSGLWRKCLGRRLRTRGMAVGKHSNLKDSAVVSMSIKASALVSGRAGIYFLTILCVYDFLSFFLFYCVLVLILFFSKQTSNILSSFIMQNVVTLQVGLIKVLPSYFYCLCGRKSEIGTCQPSIFNV